MNHSGTRLTVALCEDYHIQPGQQCHMTLSLSRSLPPSLPSSFSSDHNIALIPPSVPLATPKKSTTCPR
jgi:hypothetical protein